MTDDFEITCARCYVTMRGKDRDAVMLAFRGHEKEVHGFKTGQEFFDVFNEEFLKIAGVDEATYLDVLDAAKKAAGLEDD